MEILLTRQKFTDISTIGTFKFKDMSWFSLEDKDRGLCSSMDLADIIKGKIPGVTCIPYGVYEVVVDFSIHFNQLLPHIINVPGFDGIRIHSGNTDKDTSGCVLLGKSTGEDIIYNSRDAFNEFFPMLTEALKAERVFIRVERNV